MCPFSFIVGPLKVLKEALDWTELESKFPNILPGGCYHTKECQTRTKVALIIPYRDREPHLKAFLHNIHFMLQRQQIDYCIYVVEEVSSCYFLFIFIGKTIISFFSIVLINFREQCKKNTLLLLLVYSN